MAGRTLLPEDDLAPGTHPVLVLGHRFWENKFGADLGVVGQEVRVAGRLYTIVGIAPPDYEGHFRGILPEFLIARMMADEADRSRAGVPDGVKA